ncbi:MAG: LacI family DNA-binding transcriptional regulator [Caldilineaceae bacterium]|nr:LacI family DNA-binding transcriptional regulator [Caldilineaceae bacterium]
MSTIRDVAAKAGVNPSTVSRVFSGKATISEQTRRRVLAAAELLDFQPNAIARSLSVQRTDTIAIVVPHIFDGYFEDSFFPQVMRGLLDTAYQHGFRVLVSGSNSHADVIDQTFQILGSRQADGIVVLSNRLDVDTIGALRNQSTPFTLVGSPPTAHQDISWIDADNAHWTGVAIRHLLELGHKQIAFVGGDPDVSVTRERLQGYRQTMEDAHLPIHQEWVDFGYFAEAGGYQAVKRMLPLGPAAPTAYYAANDLMAIGILRALREENIQVPAQVSVVGTNDSAEAAHVVPALTTLRVPYAQMAAAAAELLINRIITGADTPPAQHYIDCKLIERQSTAILPVTDESGLMQNVG